MKADEVYSKLKKMIVSVSSGIKNTTSKQNQDGSVTITINFTSGSPLTFTMNPVKGDKGVGIKDALIKEIQNVSNKELHLILIDDEGNDIDAGKLPISPDGGIELSDYVTKDNSIKSIKLVSAIPTGSTSTNKVICLQLIFADNKKVVNISLEDLLYDDTQVRTSINNLNYAKQDKIDDTLKPNDKTIVGSINEIYYGLLDNVTFSADYKNIILNRKGGNNPYVIPIASIIHNANITEFNDVDSTNIGDEKVLVYDSATKKHKYVDSIRTDELVKMDNTTDAKHLIELIDKTTIVNDNGVLKAKKLDGQEVTITEINYLKGLTMNIVDLVKSFASGGVKMYEHTIPTYADLLAMDRSSFVDGIRYFVYVLADETHGGIKTTYICDKTNTSYFGVAGDDRDFTAEPINLTNEVTGKLPPNNIDVESLWKLVTVYDTYKELTSKNEPFSTHGAKNMYDELIDKIGNKANNADLTKHTDDTNIHITTAERTKWNNVDNKVDKDNIITSKNDNATNEQAYSAYYINTELNNYVKKTDLSTLLAVNDLNNLKGYIFMVGRGDGNTSNIPSGVNGAFVVGYIPYNTGNNNGVQRLTTVEDKCVTFERSLNNGVWGEWQKMCTTSVVDVPITNIAPADETKFVNFKGNPRCNYCVKNGICYVTLWDVKITSTEATDTNVVLPTPLSGATGTIMSSNGDATPRAFAYILENAGSTLRFASREAGMSLYGQFSYPVAEQ